MRSYDLQHFKVYLFRTENSFRKFTKQKGGQNSMTALYIISFILLVVATAILLKLTPEQVGEDIENIIVSLNRQQTLKDQSLTARGKKKKNKLLLSLERMRNALEETGKRKQFSAACAAALLLMVVGCITAIAIDNSMVVYSIKNLQIAALMRDICGKIEPYKALFYKGF